MIEYNDIFPIKTNVNFCKVIDHKNIESTIYIPGSVQNGDVFAPGNTEAFETNFITNYIVS